MGQSGDWGMLKLIHSEMIKSDILNCMQKGLGDATKDTYRLILFNVGLLPSLELLSPSIFSLSSIPMVSSGMDCS